MLKAIGSSDPRTRLYLLLFVFFLLAVFLFGGASRADAMSQPLPRMAAVLVLACCAAFIRRREWGPIRAPVLFLCAVAFVICIQLIPLPPQLWADLPGRALYMSALEVMRMEVGWRPITLTPVLTLNALLAVLPPLAAVTILGMIDRSLHVLLVPLLIAIAVLSAVLGIVQVSSESFYFYRVTNPDSAVGLFANRNHQALFLATCLPLLACWITLPNPDRAYRELRFWVALCIGAAILPMLLITGSRAGLGLGIVGAVAAIALVLGHRRRRRGSGLKRSARFWAYSLIPVGIGLAAIFATFLLSRDEAVRRMVEGQQGEMRGQLLSVFTTMARDFFPFGSGFGSFDTVFRIYEPHGALRYEYLNHAHNDLVQIAIEGGLPAVLLLLLFFGWFMVRSWQLWRTAAASPLQMLGRAGSIIVLLIILGSLVDYPLRTPLISTMMAIACFWMLPLRGNMAQETRSKR